MSSNLRSRTSHGPKRVVLASLLCVVLGSCSAIVAPEPPSRAPAPELADLVLSALDSEALYTAADGIKPVSSGFWREELQVDDPGEVLSDIETTRQHLARLTELSPRDERGRPLLWWGALSFAKAYNGERSLHAYVVHRQALSQRLQDRSDVFGPLGLTPSSEPAEVLAIVERLPKLDRYRAYGLLFGYPEPAVEFFVEAAAARGDGDTIVPRDFRHIPTVASEQGRFVYAVPVGAVPTAEEDALRLRCVEVLDWYRTQREAWVEGRRSEVDIQALLATIEREARALAPAPAR